MSQVENLSNHILIATPNLRDPNFHRSIVFICEDQESGAIGLMINRRSDMTMSDIFAQMKIEPVSDKHNKTPVLYGGPVQVERGFVLHSSQGHWNSSLEVSHNLWVTTSQDIIHAIAKDAGPEQYLFILGYSGWGDEQLWDEIKENAWLCCEVSNDLLFEVPLVERYRAALKKLGIVESQLTTDFGRD